MKYALIADRLWDGVEGEVQSGLAVVVDGQHISEITPVDHLPPSLTRVELPGCTLIPGLIDAHVHYSAVMGPAFLAAGVTTIRDVGNNLDWIVKQRELNAADPKQGPGIVCCGYLLDGSATNWKHMGRPHADEAELRASIREHVARGADQIKLYAQIDAEMMRIAVDEAHSLQKFVVAHLGIPMEEAVAAGLDEFEHLSGCEVAWRSATEAEDDIAINLLLDRGVVIAPTLVVWERFGRILDRALHHDERRFWAHPCHRDVWNRFPHRYDVPSRRFKFQEAIPHLKRFLRRASERNVTIALGTDTPFPHLIPGFSVHDELAMYVDAGISPIDALRPATSVNAKVLGLEGKCGKIQPGYMADLLAVRGNPCACIDDIDNTELVIRHGERLDIEQLRGRMREASKSVPDDTITTDLLRYVNNFENESPHQTPASVGFYAAALAATSKELQ